MVEVDPKGLIEGSSTDSIIDDPGDDGGQTVANPFPGPTLGVGSGS